MRVANEFRNEKREYLSISNDEKWAQKFKIPCKMEKKLQSPKIYNRTGEEVEVGCSKCDTPLIISKRLIHSMLL